MIGLALGGLAMGLLFVIYTGAGWLTIERWGWENGLQTVWLALLWGSILSNLQAALGEEVIFRGFLLTGLKPAWGPAAALGIMAVLFTLMHLLVPTASETPLVWFVIALTLPGLLLGWTFLRTGSLWLPIGIHFAWNFVQTDLLNLNGTDGPRLFGAVTHLSGPSWLVGTAFGVEVGLLGLIPLVVIGFGVWIWTRSNNQRAAENSI